MFATRLDILLLSIVIVVVVVVAGHVDSSSFGRQRLDKRGVRVASLPANGSACRLYARDASVNGTLQRLVREERKSLIEFNLVTPGKDRSIDARKALDLREWMRISTSHGRTLAEMGIRHGSLAGLTLSQNSARLVVDLIDQPSGCFELLQDDDDRLNAIRNSLVRDFRADGEVTLTSGERVCHRVVRENFDVDTIELVCYGPDEATGQVVEKASGANVWLKTLKVLLAAVRIVLYFFGARFFLPLASALARERVPYAVKLKKAMTKRVVFRGADQETAEGAVTDVKSLNLRQRRHASPKLSTSARRIEPGRPVDVKITQLDISVDYGRTMVENKVHAGLLETLFKGVFKCSLKNVEPFRSCCAKDAMKCPGCCCRRRRSSSSSSSSSSRDQRTARLTWNRCCQLASFSLMVVLLHAPLGLRLVIFYAYELGSVLMRKEALSRLGLDDSFDGSLFRYLLPTHPIFIVAYVLYVATAVNAVVAAAKSSESDFAKVVVGSFLDLRSSEWSEVAGVAATNVVWPLKRFGFLGFFVGLFYWSLVLPLTLLLLVVYLVPVFYLAVRLVVRSVHQSADVTRVHKEDKPYRTVPEIDRSVRMFNLERFLSGDGDGKEEGKYRNGVEISFLNVDALKVESIEGWNDNLSSTSHVARGQGASGFCRRFVCAVNMTFALLALIVSSILVSEILGTLVEVMVFLIMGILLNAAELLKYVVLVFLILTYGLQCYNDVSKKYLKLNKALFKSLGEILESDLDEITSAQEGRQENRGLKFTREGGDKIDQISTNPPNHWLICDLVMFMDSRNVPRIPRKLFEQVCLMDVPGSPGPVYQSHVKATQRFLKIVVFISFLFIIVLTYGTVYNVSHANQMLATLAGGMIPHILKSMKKESASEIEIESVTFKNKLGHTIKNFVQYWPILDFPFELDRNPNRSNNSGRGESETSRQTSLPDATEAEQILRLTGNMKAYLVREKCLSGRFSDPDWTRSSSANIDLVVYLPEEIDLLQ